MRTFSEALQRRRRRTEVMTSMRSEGLVIDTIVCLTLAKRETVSDQFGGYLRVWLRVCCVPRHIYAQIISRGVY